MRKVRTSRWQTPVMTIRQFPAHLRKIEINCSRERVRSLSFTKNGKQVLSSGIDGVIRRWRVADGQKVGKPIPTEGAEVFAAILSPDGKWLVYAFQRLGDRRAEVRVLDARTHEKVFDIKDHKDRVPSVDISADSTRFATGSFDKSAAIWNMTTGELLVGPMQHEDVVVTVQFSPNGDRIATATAAENPDDPRTAKSIRIYDSENGQLLFDIPFRIWRLVTSLAWSSDGRQLFAASYSEAKCFDTLSRSLLIKWSVPGGGRVASVALSRNQKFVVIAAFNSLSFWNTSTHRKIGPTIEHTSSVWSIRLSPDDDYIATGEDNGKVTLRSLRGHPSYLVFDHKCK